MKKGTIFIIVIDLLVLLCFFLAYGPINYFKNLLVTTAMTTMDHKYFAYILYDEETVKDIMSNNSVSEILENTDISDIKFEITNNEREPESIYDEQILTYENNQLYKVINISGNSYKGYLVAIYDPSRVHLAMANDDKNYGGEFLTNIARRNNALVAINASGFTDESSSGMGSVATGNVIKDGKLIVSKGDTGYGGGLAGFNKDNILVLTKDSPEEAIKNGMRDAVEFGPFLIVNGKPAEIKGNGGWGIAPRTVLAQRKDGIVLFLVIDGRNFGHSLGVDMNELISILTKYKAHNAVNLDGGGSSTLVVEGKLTNIPCSSTCGERYIPNAWILK